MMIQSADRLKGVAEYFFSKKLEVIRQMQAQGKKVINLGIGSPDLPPANEVIEAAVQEVEKQSSHGYAPYRSTAALREAMAEWYFRTYEVKLDSERNILPLLGSKEGIFYIHMAFLNSGDQVLVPNPGYPSYTSSAQLVGAEAVPYRLDEARDWQPDWAALESMDLSRVKLMWVNYPHMPTGATASDSLFVRLIEFAKKRNILLCHDNPYGLVLNSEAPKSLLKFDPEFSVGLELNSLSKSFNMAGWRVGMLSGSESVINTVLQVKSNVDSGMFLAVQAGAIAALKTSPEWHQSRNAVYQERRVWVWKILDHLGFHYDSNQVGMFVWAKAPDSITDVVAYVDQLLEKTSVFLVPGLIFGSQGSRYVRLSLCSPVDVLKEALDRIQKL